MTEGDFAINGGFPGARVTPSSVTGRFAAVCSKVQNSCIDHELPLPSVLKSPFIIVDGPQSSATGNPEEITKLFPKLIAKPFPKLFGQPSAALVSSDSHAPHANRKLKIGVVLSGVQPPDGHNVIFGIFDKE
ncbi:Pyrophosphate--fructose 6-phosphate 1-phosphotransferase subunit beta [Glycine soja]|uniref:Pyrophosphate--fructose 6-phosphate 1-phosphotransferase subunit beta n=1 Tax=Glycine soja TaxID=3848 RepID=A0A0B2QBY2_GLYSO|nr:Pyrophosphate--fructose 6-phosphate 1-phosphotransferase subunit beta [Glycine soja]